MTAGPEQQLAEAAQQVHQGQEGLWAAVLTAAGALGAWFKQHSGLKGIRGRLAKVEAAQGKAAVDMALLATKEDINDLGDRIFKRLDERMDSMSSRLDSHIDSHKGA